MCEVEGCSDRHCNWCRLVNAVKLPVYAANHSQHRDIHIEASPNCIAGIEAMFALGTFGVYQPLDRLCVSSLSSCEVDLELRAPFTRMG
jgi:hypothetical protein